MKRQILGSGDSFSTNIEKDTLNNRNFRKVIATTRNMQLVVMSLGKGEDIGMEVHKNISQFIRVERGTARAIIGEDVHILNDGDIVIIPPNTVHNITNIGNGKLQLYTIYTPPNHAPGKIEKFKIY
jgi:mannose-6-phosphate isomerase-like protein (cupin superfamily)